MKKILILIWILTCEKKRQPDAVGVKECRQHLVHNVKEVTGARWVERVGVLVIAQRVQVKVPGGRGEEREKVRNGHRQKDQVGGRTHVRLRENDHNEKIGDEGGHEEEGQYVAKEDDAQVLGHVSADVQQEGDVVPV